MMASRISFAPWPALVTSTPLDQSSQRLPYLSKTKMSSARSHTIGGWPRMDCGSNGRSVSRIASESGCGNGVTTRRSLVSTRGTSRGVTLNSLPIEDRRTGEQAGVRLERGNGEKLKTQGPKYPSTQIPKDPSTQTPKPNLALWVFWSLGISLRLLLIKLALKNLLDLGQRGAGVGAAGVNEEFAARSRSQHHQAHD